MFRLQPHTNTVAEQPTHVSPWGRDGFISRSKAASIHLAISATAAFAITIPIVLWLYPSPFFEAAGGLNLLAIILAIDIVLGPSLTFLVFDRAKKSLGFDLKIIAALQIAALAYGLYATAASRPVYMTYVVDRFELVSAADVDPDELKKGPQEIQQVRWGHPQLTYAEQPTTENERSTIVFSALNGVDLNRLFRYYKAFEQARPKILERAKPIKELNRFNSPEAVKRALEPFPNVTLVFVPMQGRKRDLTALIDAQTGDLVKVVDLKPWVDSK